MGITSKLFGRKREKHEAKYSLKDIARYYEHLVGENVYLKRYFKACEATGSKDNFMKQNRFFSLYQSVQNVLRRGLPGDMAECGCWKGHSTYLMAGLLAEANWQGTLRVFDSFEGGLSDKSAEDRTQQGDTDSETTARQKAKFQSDLESVRQALSPFPFVSLHKGWIPQVFDGAVPDGTRFSLVHVDVDLYQPTIDSLRFFYPRMVKGGIIVIDDYGSTRFPGCWTAVDEFLHEVEYDLFLEGHIQGAVLVV